MAAYLETEARPWWRVVRRVVACDAQCDPARRVGGAARGEEIPIEGLLRSERASHERVAMDRSMRAHKARTRLRNVGYRYARGEPAEEPAARFLARTWAAARVRRGRPWPE